MRFSFVEDRRCTVESGYCFADLEKCCPELQVPWALSDEQIVLPAVKIMMDARNKGKRSGRKTSDGDQKKSKMFA